MKKTILNVVYIGSGVLAFGLFAGGAGAGYTRVLGPFAAFQLFVVGMLIGLIVAVAGVVDAAKHGVSTKSIILVMGMLPTCVLGVLVVQGRDYPMINDVTTDLVFPPEFVHAKTIEANADLSMDFPLEFKEDIESSYSDLIPLAKLWSVDDTYFQAMDVVKGITNWEITANRIDGKDSYIEGTVTSKVFGFVDDFVIRIAGAGGGGCVVDMRSRSRSGKGDFGQNAEHIHLFMKQIE